MRTWRVTCGRANGDERRKSKSHRVASSGAGTSRRGSTRGQKRKTPDASGRRARGWELPGFGPVLSASKSERSQRSGQVSWLTDNSASLYLPSFSEVAPARENTRRSSRLE